MAWRASGQTAEAFSAAHGLTVGTLRWWSSRLRREERRQVAGPAIRLARVVRSADRAEPGGSRASGMVIELRDARIALEGRVDRDALAIVVAVLRADAR